MMKKILLSVCLLMLACGIVNAQELSFRLGLGYAFPTASQTLGPDGMPYSGNVTNSTTGGNSSYSAKRVSFSSGLKLSGGLQYMFTKNIGVAADISVGLVSQKYVLQENNGTSIAGKYNGSGNIGSNSSDNTYTRYAKLPVILLPSLIIQSGGDKLNIYARGGVALPLSAQVISEEHDIYQNVAGDDEQLNKNIKTQFNLGFAGALGAVYRTNENFSLWIEANFMSLSLYPKEADITAHNFDGATSTAPPVPSSKITYITSGTPNNGEQLSFSVPFSNIGFMVGGSINLGKKKIVHPHE
ncbi:MAG: hypothetical protein JSS96_04660 [Bacteroidetes bacterium]|nr:hypothetical protein [Bacteroidota bacterium]